MPNGFNATLQRNKDPDGTGFIFTGALLRVYLAPVRSFFYIIGVLIQKKKGHISLGEKLFPPAQKHAK